MNLMPAGYVHDLIIIVIVVVVIIIITIIIITIIIIIIIIIILSVFTGQVQSTRALQQQSELGMVIGSRAHMQQAAVNKRAWHRYTVLHYCHLAYNCIPHVL